MGEVISVDDDEEDHNGLSNVQLIDPFDDLQTQRDSKETNYRQLYEDKVKEFESRQETITQLLLESKRYVEFFADDVQKKNEEIVALQNEFKEYKNKCQPNQMTDDSKTELKQLVGKQQETRHKSGLDPDHSKSLKREIQNFKVETEMKKLTTKLQKVSNDLLRENIESEKKCAKIKELEAVILSQEEKARKIDQNFENKLKELLGENKQLSRNERENMKIEMMKLKNKLRNSLDDLAKEKMLTISKDAKITELEAELTAQKEKTEKSSKDKEENTKHELQVKQLKTKLEKISAELVKVNLESVKKDKKIKDLEAQSAKARNMFADLESELKGLVDQNNGKDKEMEEMRKNIEELVKQVESLVNMLKASKVGLVKKEAKISG